MKRKSPESKKTPRKPNPNKNISWSRLEEKTLIKTVSEVKHRNWRMIAKTMNEKNKGKTRTPEECEEHYYELKPAEKPIEKQRPKGIGFFRKKLRIKKCWTLGENCALLCGCILHENDWEQILASVPGRRKSATKKHILEIVTNVGKMIKENLAKNIDEKDYLEIFKVLSCIKLIISTLENSALYPELNKSIEKLQLTVRESLNFISTLNCEPCKEKTWTVERLNAYLLSAVDRIQNNKHLQIGDDDSEGTLDGLIHERPEEPVFRPDAMWFPGLRLIQIEFHE